jgi:transposase
MGSPKAATLPPGWGSFPSRSRPGDRTILGKISKRGNRYLRVLFVQAAWAVLIKPKS